VGRNVVIEIDQIQWDLSGRAVRGRNEATPNVLAPVRIKKELAFHTLRERVGFAYQA